MDERLEKALEFSNYMVTLSNQKRMLKEKYYEDLIYFQNGCQFTITKELITFVGLLVSTDNNTDVVIVDDNDIPAMIKNLNDFYENILDVYFTASNEYNTEYNKLKTKRSVNKLVDLDE